MNETFPIAFYGGSQDGTVTEGNKAPDVYLVNGAGDVKEIYTRQTDQTPFIYLQVWYAENESAK